MIPPIHTSLAVAERVDVDLDRVLEEAVEEDRGLGAGCTVWVGGPSGRRGLASR